MRDDLAEALVFDDRAYRRIAIHRRAHYEALVLCWKSGQSSSIHDHSGSSCAVRVVEGCATEIRFAPSSCGLLVPVRSRSLPAGSILGCPGGGIHQMANLERSGRDLITLHVYSPPPSEWRFYGLDETTLAAHDQRLRNRLETLVFDFGHTASETSESTTPSYVAAEPIAVEAGASARRERVVAIVGGGFSGAMVAVHLARLSQDAPVRVVLFEKGDRFARGLAYSTRSDHHLLNVPAGLMSALPDEPSSFLDWLRTRDASAHHGTFAPRRVYGEYLEELLARAAVETSMPLELVPDEVVELDVMDEDQSARLTTRQGNVISADRIVLALGHQPPQDPAEWEGGVPASADLYVGDPWSPEALAGLDPDEPIALIGTGLTAVDLIVEARANGHCGPIHAISRHGLLPCRHPAAPVPPRPHFAIPNPGASPTARDLVRRVRIEAATCEVEGGDWRSVVDSVRPVAQTIWRSLGDGERARFIRHVAPRWDVHRHRVAPRVDETLREAARAGQLNVLAARVVGLARRDGKVAITFRRRGAETTETLMVRRVINCTGPARDIRVGPSPLLQSVIARGIGRPGPLALGLDVADSGALLDRDGREQSTVFAIGPLLKERLWETTAVRELRSQALDLALKLLGLELA